MKEELNNGVSMPCGNHRAFFMSKNEYMARAIELAKKGTGYVSPNPLVGAVIVKDDETIGEGFHERYGELHAERNAFASLKTSAKGATLYVTLEPCCHYGKTPPCTEAIIENGISKVIIGSNDPNPLVAGKGAQILRDNGIEVEENFMKEECDSLNPIFFHYITTKKPFIAMKYAMTLDGKIATHTGASKWITSDKALEHVHSLRNKYSSILVGINTVLEDNPTLDTRLVEGTNPTRIILDSSLRIPLDSNIVKTASKIPTIIAYANEDSEKVKILKEKGIKLWNLPNSNNQVDLVKLVEKLGKEKIDSVLIEGGGQIHESFLKEGLVNHVYAYIAPKIFGGKEAKTPVEGIGVETPDQAALLENTKIIPLGDDLLIEADIKQGMNNVYRNN